jgi:riboflavin synthase
VGEVIAREDEAGQVKLRIRAPAAVEPFLLEKGSVTVSGVSLTAFEVRGPEFAIALVPHTLRATTLSDRGRGDAVNLEADVLARWVAKRMPPSAGGLSLAKLAEAGYDAGQGEVE